MLWYFHREPVNIYFRLSSNSEEMNNLTMWIFSECGRSFSCIPSILFVSTKSRLKCSISGPLQLQQYGDEIQIRTRQDLRNWSHFNQQFDDGFCQWSRPCQWQYHFWRYFYPCTQRFWWVSYFLPTKPIIKIT